MNTSAFRNPKQPPTRHRLEPMREGFARWRKIDVLYPPSQRKISDNCFETGRFGEFIVRLIDLMVRSNDRTTTQIPIVRCLS